MKYIFRLIFVLLLSIEFVNANSIEFYWEKNESWWLNNDVILELEWKIDNLQKTTWLNSDIVILWKGDKNLCYNKLNYDNCVKKEYWYNSDLIIILKMKSDVSNKWDMRSFMENRNLPILEPALLKTIQDSIVYNFWENNFKKWLIEYYDILEKHILQNCDKIKDYNQKKWWNSYNLDCSIASQKIIIENNKIYKEKDNIILQNKLEKERIIVEAERAKEKLIYELEAEKRAFMRIIYITVFIVILFIIVWWSYIYYRNNLTKLLADIKFRYIDISDIETFQIDREIAKKQLKSLIKDLEYYIWNIDKSIFKMRSQYIMVNKDFIDIDKKLRKSIKNYASQQKLKNKVEKIKKINI